MDWQTVSEELKKPLSPDAIKPPPQGKFGEYVDALHVIREANRIFGFDGWSYVVTRMEMVSRQVVQKEGRDGTYEQLRVGYLANVRLTIDGVTREGTAVGSGMGNPDSEADHHEAATKEAETDALKRAFRTFGNTFGLALYEKDKNAREVGYTATQGEIDEAVKGLSNCADLEALQKVWASLYKNLRYVADEPDVISAKDERKDQLTRKEAA
ncbi:Rad52/Rad22 family DNA repair protein [Ruegeria sp. HKCCD6109]|uniref:Rad52/Rad22 family DNA repair protein n=1 Tax=Ruegeria sp. HKCCD6109 TaxID=2683017 RepID=UPI0014919AC3|nr:Rad52/Rad22 family DNA repair protein [Ruegeria sp. HKCCD6109]NOD65780.1 hypothetical protein [Ruegeria sp. HKCCD6109]